MARMNPKAPMYLAILLIGGGLLVGGAVVAVNLLAPEALESVTLEKDVNLGNDFESKSVHAGGDVKNTVPKERPANNGTAEIRWGVIPWNSMIGVNHANGGPVTLEGSIADKWDVNLRIEPQDMYGEQRDGLVACATQMYESGSDNCTVGYTHTAMMGDAAAWYMSDLNNQLNKLGPEYRAEIIGGFGRSYGEDAWMGPPECVDNPNACRGRRFAGVQGDGDINCALAWAALNGIPVNPDGETYDPEALNWLYTGSFDEADKAYINNQCEDLPIVRGGKRTKQTQNVCIEGTATWTPGDVNVARQRGGVVKIYSTYENGNQMGNAIIGIRKWDQAHKQEVVNWLAAGFEGNYEIRTSREALAHGGVAAYAIYQTEIMNAEDWASYYTRGQERDVTGLRVWLGGSQAFVLEEALAFYGIDTSAGEPFRRSYTLFGDLAVDLWPGDISSYPVYEDVFNGEYLVAMAALEGVQRGADVRAADAPDYTKASTGPQTVLGKRSWNIQFQSGSAQFNAAAAEQLSELASLLVLADNTRIELHGHTDSDGNEEANQTLSEDRAFAVKTYLEEQGSGRFSEGSIQVFAHGETNPVSPNSTVEGRSQNRRVVVKVIAL